MAITPFNTARAPVPSSDPFEQMFRRLIDGDASPATAGAFSPSLDVREDQDVFTLYVELPGVSADDVGITLEDNVLTIAGQHESYDEAEQGQFRRVERSFGRFHRSVRLPDRVIADDVTATYANGILTITVPKAEEAKPRRVAIQA
jgi:HSP20 family protein